MKRMWGGGFDKEPSRELMRFTTWTDIEGLKGSDYYLYEYALTAEYAYIIMLIEDGILDANVGKAMINILDKLWDEEPNLKGYEDIHTFIEDKILKSTGYTPHICRSRNDEVITIERLYMRENILLISRELNKLIETLFKISKKYKDIIIPLYTHHRQADISTFGHLTLSYVETLLRDYKSLIDLYNYINLSPYGSGAIAGCILDINRYLLASLLGFRGLNLTSIDAISSRSEYISRYIYHLATILKKLARVSRDLIYYSLDEVSIVNLPEEYSTGSSSLPHKKNPDPLELIIGKSDKVSGYINIVLSIAGESSGYHRETQEFKHMMIVSTLETLYSINILDGLLKGIEIDVKRARDLVKESLKAPEIANYLAYKYKLPFRKVHRMMGDYFNLYSEIDYDKVMNIMKKYGFKIRLDPRDIKIFKSIEDLVRMKNIAGGPGDIENIYKVLKVKYNRLKRKWYKIYHEYDEWYAHFKSLVDKYGKS